MTDAETTRDLVAAVCGPPEAAIEAYPDACACCGASADPFWIPDDYHEQPPAERDPGVCTECGHHFGQGKPSGWSR